MVTFGSGNTGEQAQIFTVICCDEYMAEEFAITSAETCARYLIVASGNT